MILDQENIDNDVTLCGQQATINMSMDATINVNVTTCIDIEEEGIFDDTFDFTFE